MLDRALSKTTKLNHGAYTIYKKISSGGFGIVYLAYNLHGLPVAIKEFFPVNVGNRSEKNRITFPDTKAEKKFLNGLSLFKEEAAIIMRIDHKNIIKVTDFFEENNTAYIVMPFEYGTTLSKYMSKHKETLTEDEIIHFALETTSAIKTVHEHGMVHLDLKPGNIWIRPNKEALLLDFGTAKILNSNIPIRQPAYTPGFAPPEQYKDYFHSDRIGPWSDYYGLGATIYNLIEKHSPPNVLELLEKKKSINIVIEREGQFNEMLLNLVQLLMALKWEDRKAINIDNVYSLLDTIKSIKNDEQFSLF